MFGATLKDLLNEDDKPTLRVSPLQAERGQTVTLPSGVQYRPRGWLLLCALLALSAIAVVAGWAIVAAQERQPQPVIAAQVPADKSAELTAALAELERVKAEAAKRAEPTKPVVAEVVPDEPDVPTPAPPKIEPPKPETKDAKVETKPAVRETPAVAKETDEEFDRRIREKVAKERAARFAAMEKDEVIVPSAKGNHKLTWVAGAKSKVAKELLDQLAEFQHEEIERENNEYDRDGPRVVFTGTDGLQSQIRVSRFSADTVLKIKAKFGLVSHAAKFPQVDYPLNFRNANLPDGGGCCLWASASTLAYLHGYNFRLEDNRRGGSTPYHGVRVLKANGIPAQYTEMTRRKNVQYLRDACDEGLGATVGVCLGYQGGWPMLHEINLAGINDTHAAVLDNNDRQLKVRTVPIDKFLKMWDGSSIVIFPKGKENALAKYGKPNRYGQVDPNRRRELGDEKDGGRGPAGPGPRPLEQDSDTGRFDPTGSYIPPPPQSWANCSPSRATVLRTGPFVLEPHPGPIPPPPDSLDVAIDYFRAAGYTDAEIKVKLTQYHGP